MAYMSAKFDEDAHNSLVYNVFTSLFQYMSIVSFTFAYYHICPLLPPKSIGFIL